MYDRAPRKICFLIGSTPKNIGPGSYNHQESTLRKLGGDGYAPFMSMASRESFWNPSDDVIAAPGPGQYDPELPQQYVKGASALLSKSKRFELKPLDTPGPGSYEVKSSWTKDLIHGPCSAPPVALPKPPPECVNVHSRRVKYHRKSAAPSIPCPGQSYGYEENDDGTLKKQDPPTRDNTLGPAFYAPLSDETCTTKMYKGIHFGQMKSGRSKLETKDGPGPGQYDPFIDCKTTLHNINMTEKNKCKFESYVPRYLDKVVENERRQGVPGPGKYDITRTFDVIPPSQPELMPIEQPPFLTQAKRFQPIKNDIPAPGTYNDPRTALENLKKLSGMKNSPFGQTAIRFERQKASNTPGPASYKLKGIAEDIQRKALESCTKRCAFGTCAERGGAVTLKDAPDLPGPASYQIEEKPCRPRIVRMSSNFASQSHRLSNPPGLVVDIPPPGSYDVIESFQKVNSKCEMKPPRTEAAKKRQGSFLSSASRFAPPRDVIIAEPDPAVPGPGMYYPKMLETNRGSFVMPKDCRFRKDGMDETPGPGAYEFSPMIQDTVLKGTFNATLNNPLLSGQPPVPFREIKPALCT